MVLPFVRELLADLEHSDSFERVRGTSASPPGADVSPDSPQPPARCIFRSSPRPRKFRSWSSSPTTRPRTHCSSPSAPPASSPEPSHPERVLRLPAHDVLPFENLSPHPDVQEQRATVLWKIASGEASIVIAPVEAASMRLFPAELLSRSRTRACAAMKRSTSRSCPAISPASAIPRWTSSRCPANSPAAAASSTFIRPRPTAPSASSSSATRSNRCASSTPTRSVPPRRSTKRRCCH